MPPAAFGNQNGSSTAMNYPDEIQVDDDEEESEAQLKNRHLRQDDGSDPNFAYYRDDEGRIINTEEAMRQ